MSTDYQVRIIGGKWRGRKLRFPDTGNIRPTGDRIRETVFNWLQMDIVGAKCLDLFSGSGAFGFESLSRGAAEVVMVVRHPAVIQSIEHNANQLSATHYRAVCADIPSERLTRSLTSNRFDIVYIDPPYHVGLALETCQWLITTNLIADEGLIYLETEAGYAIDLPWKILKDKQTKSVHYRLFRR